MDDSTIPGDEHNTLRHRCEQAPQTLLTFPQGYLGTLAFADIPKDPLDDGLAGDCGDRRRHAHGFPNAGLGDHVELVVDCAVRFDVLLETSGIDLRLPRGVESCLVLADDFRPRAFKELLCCAIAVDEHAGLGVGPEDSVPGVLEEHPELLFTGGPGLLRALALGYVDEDRLNGGSSIVRRRAG